MRLPLPALLLATVPLTGHANESAPEDRSWSGNAEFGLAIASGNADSETINGKFAFLREEDRWFYGLNAAGLRAKSDDQLSANRYEAGLKLGYDFTGRTYLFGSLRYENDDFASYEYQSIAAVGVGYRFIDAERTTLLGEIGPGARRFQPIDALVGTPPVLTPVDAETDSIVRGSLDFKHALTGNTALTNLLLAESGGGSTFLQNDLGVAVQMSERFALKAGYQVRHTTEVPEGIEKTDTLFTTNLVVGF
jgi:putative salt-induced outer membrane protein